jgi:hypothetical protein
MSLLVSPEIKYDFVNDCYIVKYDLLYDPEPEERYLAIISGEKPRNKEEVKMLQEIFQMMKEGKIIDIPSM